MRIGASLHGQVGQLVVQLRDAHADFDWAQQQLQQERQVRHVWLSLRVWPELIGTSVCGLNL
jgi:hypothetical protein